MMMMVGPPPAQEALVVIELQRMPRERVPDLNALAVSQTIDDSIHVDDDALPSTSDFRTCLFISDVCIVGHDQWPSVTNYVSE